MCTMTYAALFVILMATSPCWAVDQLTCGRGQWVNGSTCSPCPRDMYMDDDNHTNTRCSYCYTNDTIKNKNAMKITTACNTTHQAEVGCIEGYIHVPASHSGSSPGECDSCQNCSDFKEHPFQVQQCSGRFDTVCCQKEDMVAVLVGDKYECRGRGAGSTGGKRQGPNVTDESERAPPPTTSTESSTNTTTYLNDSNKENRGMPDWAIPLIVISAIVVLGAIALIVIKKRRATTNIINLNDMKKKDGEDKDNDKESEMPLNPA